MTEEIATADAEAGKISVDKTNISVTDFAQRRIGDLLQGLNSPGKKNPKKALSRKLKKEPKKHLKN